MRVLALLLLIGCEAMDAPGRPLEAVDVAASQTVDEPSQTFNEGPSSVEEAPVVDVTIEEEGSESVEDPESLHEADGDIGSVLTSEEEAFWKRLDELQACQAASPEESPDAELGGVIRLDTTYVKGNQPLALLILPDGSAAKVEVGSMFADLGVVVMSIGEQQVQIAQISPSLQGAEATMLLQTLRVRD